MDFSQLNETDVREEILAPLIRELGYRSASEHNVLREQSLRYPRVFIGRKEERRDPILRGKADYILEAGRRVRWVVEAKAPSCALDIDEVEQAWTYANHPEVRAVYFVLCNGKRLSIYQTNGGPSVAAILSVTYQQLQESDTKEVLSGLLSPQAVLRDHPLQFVDTNVPLAPGLRSIARIANGMIRYDRSTVAIPALSELQVTIVSGAIERDESDRMIALLETRAPTRTVQALTEKLGLSVFEMTSSESKLSTNREVPTVFEYTASVTFPEGEELLDMTTWKTVRLPRNLPVRVKATATGCLDGSRFSGAFRSEALYDERISVCFEGEFSLFLS